jgi:hypothetical protein
VLVRYRCACFTFQLHVLSLVLYDLSVL